MPPTPWQQLLGLVIVVPLIQLPWPRRVPGPPSQSCSCSRGRLIETECNINFLINESRWLAANCRRGWPHRDFFFNICPSFLLHDGSQRVIISSKCTNVLLTCLFQCVQYVQYDRVCISGLRTQPLTPVYMNRSGLRRLLWCTFFFLLTVNEYSDCWETFSLWTHVHKYTQNQQKERKNKYTKLY